MTILTLAVKTHIRGFRMSASDQAAHSLSLIQHFLDASTRSKVDLFKFKDKYGGSKGV